MLHRSLVLCVVLLCAGAAGCAFLPGAPGHAEWHADVYENVPFDDVFLVAEAQIDRDYDVRVADRDAGRIESGWDYGGVSPVARLIQREQVIAEIEPVEEGVLLRLRVRRQTKERLGLLAGDQDTEEGWEDAADDPERAGVIFAKIQAVLLDARPSGEFYEKRRYDPDAPPPEREFGGSRDGGSGS